MLRLLSSFLLVLVGHFALAQGYTTNGNAVALGGDCYRLTQEINYNLGTVWYNDAINLNEPFDLSFEMNFGTRDADGADGMVWVLQTIGTTALGSSGSGMGFGGFAQSFGIEFDTFSNNQVSDPAQNLQDPLFDHIAFLRNGNVDHDSPLNLSGPVALSATSDNVEDGQNHRVRIVWDPAQTLVQAYFDCQLRLQANIPLNTFFNNVPVYWGFTGSTGGFTNVQTVCLSPEIMTTEEEYNICEGASIALGNELVGSNFSWSPDVFLSSNVIQNPVATPPADQVYVVTYLDLCNFQQQKEYTVLVENLPTADAGDDVFICPNSTTTLAGSGSSGSYFWTTANGLLVSSAAILAPTVAQAGEYTFTVTSFLGCIASDVVLVVDANPPSLELGPDVSICPGEIAFFEIDPNWQTIVWSTGNSTNSISVENTAIVSVNVEYNGCAYFDQVEVSVVELPNLNLGPDLEVCNNVLTSLQANALCTWNTGEVGTELQVEESGIYWCEFVSGACSIRDSILVEVYDYPQFSIPSNIELCNGESYLIETTIPVTWNGTAFSSTYTIDGDNEVTAVAINGACINSQILEIDYISAPAMAQMDSLVICEGRSVDYTLDVSPLSNVLWWDGSQSSTQTFTETGAYAVEVYNECGSVRDTLVVETQECESHVFAPSAFTPDYDGVNDVWKIEATDVVWFSARVYNRWGDVIWESSSPSEVWEGDVHNGEYFSQIQAYAYTVDYISKYSTDVYSLRGFVTVLR